MTVEGDLTADVTTPIQLAANVRGLDRLASGTFHFESDSIEVPFEGNESLDQKLAPGDVVVSAQGVGAVRSVLRVDKVTMRSPLSTPFWRIVTGAASLSDVFSEGAFSFTIGGNALTSSSNDTVALGALASASRQASVTLTPSLTTQLKFSKGALDSAQISSKLDVSSSLVASLTVGGTAQWGKTDRFFSSPPLIVRVAIPGVPFPLIVLLTVTIDVFDEGMATAKATAARTINCNGSLGATLSYAGDWSTSGEAQANCTSPEPSFVLVGKLETGLGFKPAIRSTFWGLGGPFLEATHQAQLAVQICPAPAAISGAYVPTLAVGVETDVFGRNRAVRKPISSASIPLFNHSLTAPQACDSRWDDAKWDDGQWQ